MCVGGLMVNSLLDSGSSVSLVTTSIVQQSGYTISEGSTRSLFQHLEISGILWVAFVYRLLSEI